MPYRLQRLLLTSRKATAIDTMTRKLFIYIDG